MNMTRNGLSRVDAPSETTHIEALYVEHADWVLGLCQRWLSNRADAEDACQETFLRAASALTRFRGESSLRWWLAAIARNVCNETIRRRRPTASLDAAPEREASPGADREAERRRVASAVHGALAALPPRDRDYVELAHFGGHTNAEIAALDGSSLAAARTRLMRARHRFRNAIAAVIEGEQLWPLPVVVLGLPGRIRARWADRAGIRRLASDISQSSSASLSQLSAVLTPTLGQVAVVVVGTAGLALGPSGDPPSLASPEPMAPIASVDADRHIPPRSDSTPPEPGSESHQSAPRPAPDDNLAEPPAAPTPSDPVTPPVAGPVASPTVGSNAEEVVSEPVQTENQEERSGYYVEVPGASVDVDGDGEHEIITGDTTAGMGCFSSDRQGPVTKAACDNAGRLPEAG